MLVVSMGVTSSERRLMLRPAAIAGGEVRWHREFPSPAHLGSDRMEVNVDRTLVGDLGDRAGSRVRIDGWLHHQRQLAKVAFVLVRDRSGITQVVVLARVSWLSG